MHFKLLALLFLSTAYLIAAAPALPSQNSAHDLLPRATIVKPLIKLGNAVRHASTSKIGKSVRHAIASKGTRRTRRKSHHHKHHESTINHVTNSPSNSTSTISTEKKSKGKGKGTTRVGVLRAQRKRRH